MHAEDGPGTSICAAWRGVMYGRQRRVTAVKDSTHPAHTLAHVPPRCYSSVCRGTMLCSVRRFWAAPSCHSRELMCTCTKMAGAWNSTNDAVLLSPVYHGHACTLPRALPRAVLAPVVTRSFCPVSGVFQWGNSILLKIQSSTLEKLGVGSETCVSSH